MADMPDISQTPTQGVNTPDSGTYGEKAALDRLQAQLPGQNPQSPAAVQPTPQGLTGPAPVMPGSGGEQGAPAALFAPTNNPGVPVSTPLAPAAPVLPQPGPELRKLALRKLAEDPQVSDETRQWAQRVLYKLDRAARA